MAIAKGTAAPRKKTLRRKKSKGQAVLSVISVRISDEEKERLDELKRLGRFKRYSDMLRMAIRMIKVPDCEDRHAC